MTEKEFKQTFPDQAWKLDGKPVTKLKKRLPPKGSPLEDAMALLFHLSGIPAPKRQYKFCKERKWLMDFAWLEYKGCPIKIALEVDGETSHARYHQTTKDAEKRNRAQQLGWKVYVATGEQIKRDPNQVLEMIRKALETADKALYDPIQIEQAIDKKENKENGKDS